MGGRIWQRSGFDYIPVEPILEKDGKLRAYKTPEGNYRVYARVLKESLLEFLDDSENKNKFGQELDRQREKIVGILEKQFGILHGHIHEANFCVEMDDNGKPRLYVIDFDRAVDIRPDDKS